MAPSLPSCIGNALCSHRQASFFLLATLIPFFFPILFLCVPFLLLFLAPLSFFLLSLLLLYKVQASIQPKRSRIPDKGAFLRQPGFAEESFLEEDKERRSYEDVPESEDLDGENMQRLAASEGGEEKVLHAISSVSSESTGEEHADVKDVGSESMGEENDDVKEGYARDEWDEKQEGANVIEGIVENREEGLSVPHRDKVEDECSQVLVSPTMDSMSPKQEGKPMEVQEDMNLEGIDEHSRGTSSDAPGEGTLMHFPSTHEQGRSYPQPVETFLEERAADPRKLVPTVQSGVHVAMNEFDEGPSKDREDEIFEIAPHRIHEQGSSHFQPGETPEVGSESVEDEHYDVKEAHASRELDKKQEGNVLEGMVENREEGLSFSHRDRAEDEDLQVVASPSTESSVVLTREEQDDMMEGMSPKQDGKAMEVQHEDGNLEGTGGNFQDEHSMSSSSDGLGEGSLTFTHEQGSLYSQPGEILSEEQGADLGKDLPIVESGVFGLIHLPCIDEQGSLYSQPEKALSEEQGVVSGKDLPMVEPGVHGSIDEFDEGPSKDGGDESFEIDPHHIHEQGSSHFQPGETPPEEQGIDFEEDLPTCESDFPGWMNEFDEVPSKDGGDEVDPHRIHEQGSPHFQPEETPAEEQGFGHGGDEVDPHRIHEQGSPHFQPEETPPEEQGFGLGEDPPTGESGIHGPMNELEEGALKDGGDEVFEIGKRHTHPGMQEHDREEPGLFFEKPSGSGSSDFRLGRPEKQESLSSMKKETEEGEPSSTVTDIIEPWGADAFAKELQDDARSQQSRLVSELGVSTQSESAEWDRPSKTSSSLNSSTQEPLEDVGSQDKLQEKHRISADIYAIKKIIGYQGEDHASLMEQITALYLFLGMEPYEWDVGVDDLEKARAEVELLKVVVGVK